MQDLVTRAREKAKSLAGQSFVRPEILTKLAQMSRNELDSLDFGVVKVDDHGTILIYNRYESELASIPPSQAEGKNFFKEIAPCTNNHLFYGTFKEGVKRGDLNHLFLYTFTYKMRPTNVNVHLYRDKLSGSNFILVQKR
ncbi:MAG: PAS domain-containing protein [Leptospiraceae bacterium]|nr:PAS domain-containing protein [Leptospiraceae bacterium]MDW8306691.1 PAS domain-containing protein [Leptospiraceae bacterium]